MPRDVTHPSLHPFNPVRPYVQLLAFGLAGFALGRWCIPSPPQPVATSTPPSVNTTAAPVAPSTSIVEPTPAPAPAIDPSKSPYDRFCSAFQWRDIFGSAPRLQELIDGMTAEDFRQLEKGPFVPTPSSTNSDPGFKSAFNDALVRRWLEVDPEGAASAIIGFYERRPNYHGSGEWSAALARVRPELILSMLVAGDPAARVKELSKDAFRELAKKDPAAARRFAEQLTRPDQRKNAEINIACGIAASDPVSAVARARDLDSPQVFREALKSAEKIGPGMLQQALEANDGKFPADEASTLLMIRYPELPWDRLGSGYAQLDAGIIHNGVGINVRSAIERLTPEQCTQALDKLSQNPASATKVARVALSAAWANKDPFAALDWWANRPESDEPSSGETNAMDIAMGAWFRRDPAAASAWWERLPESESRAHLGNIIALNSGDLDLALKLFRPAPGPANQDLIARLAADQARRDPEAAMEWLNKLPANVDGGQAAEKIAAIWIESDANKAAQWIESMPKGSLRDRATQGYASAAAKADPQVAAEWTYAITDPYVRSQTALSIASAMAWKDRAGARAWVQNLTGIDERHRAALLRLFR